MRRLIRLLSKLCSPDTNDLLSYGNKIVPIIEKKGVIAFVKPRPVAIAAVSNVPNFLLIIMSGKADREKRINSTGTLGKQYEESSPIFREYLILLILTPLLM
jgi:hypothetical protein